MGTHNLPRRDDEPYDEPFTLPARLKDAGILFAISHNDDTAHERNLPYQAAMAAAFGLDPDSALKSVTLWSAQISGVGDVLGSLETGKAATLLITDGSPLEITTRISGAFIDGREIDLSSKHTKLADKYRERYRQQKSESPGVQPAPGAGGGGGGGPAGR
jgi:imidazolonepropionase-like amidohydrolase